MDGMIWYSTPRATFGLVVKDKLIVDCAPYARKWALGRSARVIWDQALARGYTVRWIPC